MKKRIIIIVLAVVLLSGVASAYFLYDRAKEPQPDLGGQTITDYSPPTEEEKNAADEQKKAVEKAQNDQKMTQSNNHDKTATVIITDAAQYDNIIEVRAFVTNHYQDGTCTITFTLDDNTVTKKTPAYRDATTTICTNPLIKRAEFPVSGNWQLTVGYSAPNGTGKSEPKTIRID